MFHMGTKLFAQGPNRSIKTRKCCWRTTPNFCFSSFKPSEYFLFLDKVTTLAPTFWRALPAQVQRLSSLSSMIPSLWLCQCKNSTSACWDVLPVCFYFWRGEATDRKSYLEKRKRMSCLSWRLWKWLIKCTILWQSYRTYCELCISSKVALFARSEAPRVFIQKQKNWVFS